MKTPLLFVGIAALVLCCHALAQTPNASRPPLFLNPKNVSEQPYHFTINAAERPSGSYRFTVNIRAKDKKFPLESGSGYLTIQDGDKLICGCSLKSDSDKSGLWFEFDVAAAYTVKSRFSLLIYSTNAEERKKLSSASGWTSYEFTLKDFVVADEITTKNPSK